MEIPGYQIKEPLGKGGMATVYLAIQESLGRPVVLKVLNAVLADDKDYFDRFLNEGRMIASLLHPNIVTIHDIGVANDVLYLSMEYVDGGDLKQRLEKGFSPAEALDIVGKIGDCLAYAHSQGIVHRDVKPANILFRKDGTPLLTDFGIAKQLDVDTDLTSTGTIMGSPHYMSPEQAEGTKIDGRGDIYSLGVIFYEMLTGRKAFHAESAIKIIMQHLQAPIPTLPREYKVLQPLLNKMLAKQRKDRFADASKLVTAVKKLQREVRVESAKIVGSKNPLAAEQADIPTIIADKPYISTSPSLTLSRKSMWVNALLQQKKALIVVGLLLGSNVLLMSYGLFVPQYASPGVVLPSIAAQAPPIPQSLASVSVAPIEPGITQPTPSVPGNNGQQVSIMPTPLPAPTPAAVALQSTQSAQDILRALHWLARNSLEEYRLVQPVNDNAWYYYRRILSIDPNNKGAQQGLTEIIKRVQWMAEKQITQGNYEQARSYVLMGLRVEPNNQELLSLNTQLFDARQTFWQRVRRLF